MQIEYKCSGGFANLNLTLRTDTRTLAPQEAATIEAMVEQVHFFEATVPDAIRPSSPHLKDSLHYYLSIDDGRRRRSIDLSDQTVPADFRPLLQLLQKMAVEKKQNKG